MAVYTDELGDDICGKIMDSSFGLKRICRQMGQPYSTVRLWIFKNHHGFADKYAHAKQMQAERLADEILEIADDASIDLPKDAIRRAGMRIESRKWLITNLATDKTAKQKDETKDQLMKITIKKAPRPQLPGNRAQDAAIQ